MKFFLTLIIFISTQAQAFEWEGAIREMFITPESYTYSSDAPARVRRELFDRGYRRFTLQPRLAWAGDDTSLFYLPKVRSNYDQYRVMNSRITQADGKTTIKPVIFENPGLGEAIPREKIRPKKPELALTSYGQQMAIFATLVRREEMDRLVVGSGLVHLMKDEKMIPRFESFLKGVRANLGPKPELVLEVVGLEDVQVLNKILSPFATKQFQIEKFVDGISIVLEPSEYFPDGYLNGELLKETLLSLNMRLTGVPVHLGRVVVPGCKNPVSVGTEWSCPDPKDRDIKLQYDRFTKLKKSLIQIEKDGIKIDSVEILESHTDFEPDVIDPKYPYYNPLFHNPIAYELPAMPIIVERPFPLPHQNAKNTACVLFDKNDNPPMVDRVGDIHSIMLESTLGAFKNWKVSRKPISHYFPGSLKSCQAIFYLGTNFTQELPVGFADEAASLSPKIPVVWFNYKFPKFQNSLKNHMEDPGFDAEVLLQADSVPGPENQDPGFFSQFDYKGETFIKIAQWNPLSQNFSSSPEIHLISVRDQNKVEVLATARHSKNNQAIPYAVKSGNLYYFADTPFSFVHYEDRYYIFCDLLWDILGEEAPTDRIALVRLEDINPTLKLEDLKWAMDYLFTEQVPFSLATIAYTSDMIGSMAPDFKPRYQPMSKFPEFIGLMKNAARRGADFVMHGTAHSCGQLVSGYDGLSGADYEFWLYPENRPLPFDSVNWVTNRLELGLNVYRELGIKPVAFEAPHYAASVLDYVIFSKMFRWNYHRTIYFPFKIVGDTALPEQFEAFNCDPAICGDFRRAVLSNLRIEADYAAFGGVSIPYIVHRDSYGQSLIPETLGMIDFAFYSPKTWRPVNKPSDIIRRARKLKVIRGAVASFFWHPQLLNPKSRFYQEVPGSFAEYGGKKSLTLVIDELRKMGYRFASISDQTHFPVEKTL